jgi:hypothetical protein
MRLTSICIILAACAVCLAQDDEFSTGMKASKTVMDALTKLEKKTGQQVVAGAERLGSIYENMIPFWRQRNAADAVKWSEEGKALAAKLASAAYAGEETTAADAFKAMQASCKPCHDAHRERMPDGKYRIK